jgi:hypothetical protein
MRVMKRITVITCLVLFSVLSFCAARADAQPVTGGFGIRGGITDNPDGVFIGGFYEIPIAPGGPGMFAIEPGLDLGFGDLGNDNADYWMLRLLAHGKFLIPVNQFLLYPILGLSVNHIDFDCGKFDNNDCDDTDVALDLGAGFRWEHLSIELTAAIDWPDIDLSIGWTF